MRSRSVTKAAIGGLALCAACSSGVTKGPVASSPAKPVTEIAAPERLDAGTPGDAVAVLALLEQEARAASSSPTADPDCDYAGLRRSSLRAAPHPPYSRDKAALEQIQAAVSSNYLVLDFDMVEGRLIAVSRACEERCSPHVQATIAMYVGLVRGSGRQNLPGASCAFRVALEWEPSIQLDAELATPPVKAAFEREVASLAKAQPTQTP